jgi:hypothetical protein
MIQISKVLNVEVGKKEDLSTIAENPVFMAFENAYGEMIVFIRIMKKGGVFGRVGLSKKTKKALSIMPATPETLMESIF